jgi:hypothetical protein
MVKSAAKIIEEELPEINRTYKTLTAFSDMQFEMTSLLILSDVLLDNWQLSSNIETSYLHSEWPLRNANTITIRFNRKQKATTLRHAAFTVIEFVVMAM